MFDLYKVLSIEHPGCDAAWMASFIKSNSNPQVEEVMTRYKCTETPALKQAKQLVASTPEHIVLKMFAYKSVSLHFQNEQLQAQRAATGVLTVGGERLLQTLPSLLDNQPECEMPSEQIHLGRTLHTPLTVLQNTPVEKLTECLRLMLLQNEKVLLQKSFMPEVTSPAPTPPGSVTTTSSRTLLSVAGAAARA